VNCLIIPEAQYKHHSYHASSFLILSIAKVIGDRVELLTSNYHIVAAAVHKFPILHP
jgi:hypothetical protein